MDWLFFEEYKSSSEMPTLSAQTLLCVRHKLKGRPTPGSRTEFIGTYLTLHHVHLLSYHKHLLYVTQTTVVDTQ
jgi:hypothetical protein